MLADFGWAYRTRFTQSGMWLHRKLRFVARSIVYCRSSAQWFARIRHSPLHALALQEPCLLDTVHRPFFDRRLNAQRRVQLLISHYDFLYQHFSPSAVQAIMQGAGLPLGIAVGKDDAAYEITLLRRGQFEKEGCISLQFGQAGRALLVLTFSFAQLQQPLQQREGPWIHIGGIQGGTDSREALKLATKQLHGLQPRLLLVWALRCLAQHMHVQAIYAVDQAHHVYQSHRYKKKKSIQIDYDDLWQAAAGRQQDNGHYLIALSVKDTPIDQRPPHKRAQYQKRGQMLQALQVQLLQALGD
jgi:uncharacterized protein